MGSYFLAFDCFVESFRLSKELQRLGKRRPRSYNFICRIDGSIGDSFRQVAFGVDGKPMWGKRFDCR